MAERRGQDHRGEGRVSDLLFFAADTVPYWRPAAVVLLVGLVIGIVMYLAPEK